MRTPHTFAMVRALEIASEFHRGQKRRDGKDYITHPIAVAELAAGMIENGVGDPLPQTVRNFVELVYILGVAHDLAEDTKLGEKAFADMMPDFPLKNVLIQNLLLLNKNNYHSYLDYILGMNFDCLAKTVKRADLQHNLSDLGPGNLRDKYIMAQYLLR